MITKIALRFQLNNLLDPKKTSTRTILPEHLRLLIDNEKRERLARRERPFECYVVDSKCLEKFLSPLREPNLTENKRFQVIVNDDGHYSILDILWTTDEKKYFLLDAPGNNRKHYLQEIMDKFSFDKSFITNARMINNKYNNLQKDLLSCSIFSFYHAVQISKIEIYRVLDNIAREPDSGTNKTTVYWDELPMQLVWVAQSLTFLDDYLARNKKQFSPTEIMEYEEWRKTHIKPDSTGKAINMAIENIFNSLVKNAIALVEKTDEKELRLICALTRTYPITATYLSSRISSSFFSASHANTTKENNKDHENQSNIALNSDLHLAH